jgi:ABC-type spermidine/putrescine transport system permease subunit I
MDNNVIGLVALILIFGGPAVVGIIAILMHFANRRKMYEAMTKMVELGKKPEEIKQLFEIEPAKKKKHDYGMLSGGIIIIGIAAGLALMAAVFARVTILAPAAFLLCLAFALIVAYYITRNKRKKNGNNSE